MGPMFAAHPRRAVALAAALLALGVAAAVAGLAAGLPFAAIFSGAQRVRPDAPAAAIAYVNAWAIAAIVAGTPLLGLTFSLPGDGRTGFLCLAALAAAAVVAAGGTFRLARADGAR